MSWYPAWFPCERKSALQPTVLQNTAKHWLKNVLHVKGTGGNARQAADPFQGKQNTEAEVWQLRHCSYYCIVLFWAHADRCTFIDQHTRPGVAAESQVRDALCFLLFSLPYVKADLLFFQRCFSYRHSAACDNVVYHLSLFHLVISHPLRGVEVLEPLLAAFSTSWGDVLESSLQAEPQTNSHLHHLDSQFTSRACFWTAKGGRSTRGNPWEHAKSAQERTRTLELNQQPSRFQ